MFRFAIITLIVLVLSACQSLAPEEYILIVESLPFHKLTDIENKGITVQMIPGDFYVRNAYFGLW